MGAGTHKLALSVKDGSPVEADPVTVDGDGELRGDYTDNSGSRVLGWSVFGGMLGAGILIGPLWPKREKCEYDVMTYSEQCGPDDLDMTGYYVGLAVICASPLALLLMESDEAHVTFVPGPVAAAPRTLALGDPRADAASSAGLFGAAAWGGSLVGRF